MTAADLAYLLAGFVLGLAILGWLAEYLNRRNSR